MKARNRRKAKRVGAWLKVAVHMLKHEDELFEKSWGLRTYSVNYSRPLNRKDFVRVIEANRKLLKNLLNSAT